MNKVILGTLLFVFAMVSCSPSRQADAPITNEKGATGHLSRDNANISDGKQLNTPEANGRVATEHLRDDSAIINEAMLAFYDDSLWRFRNDWSKGDFIVIRPIWNSEERPEFNDFLDDALQFYSKSADNSDTLEKLNSIKSSIDGSNQSFAPGAVTPLGNLDLSERIVLGEVERSPFKVISDHQIENRAGRLGAVRATGRLSPPSYSQDGRYACVEMTWLPWGRHGAHAFFFLKSTSDGWKIVHVMKWVYL